MLDETFAHPGTKFDDMGNWTDLSSKGTEYNNTHALVIYSGVAPWSSMDMTSPTQVRAFFVYGQFQKNLNEQLIIETGFAKRM